MDVYVGVVARAIEYPTNENSDEITLLSNVQIVWDRRGVWTIGPWLFLCIRHGSDAHEGRILWDGFQGEERPGVYWGWGAVGFSRFRKAN